ncbi:MAG: serine/threonine protein kinase [Polyangiales bacterium]|jgi:serine/threonine protein kinase
MDESIPQQIGRYSVDRLLGAGAMGFVYLGRDPELDRPVAIKTVRNLEMEPEALSLFLERFRNEARAAARLQHPNIVQVYDVGEEDTIGPYLVFEYVAGSTLKHILRSKGAMEPRAVVRLAEEIGDALTVAHDAGIIHRDIKPDNLLITPDGQAKLADFGIARIPNATLTREGQFLGTPCYAAPETLAEGAYSIRSDLFSFAAVLYEAATGKRAFPGDDALSVAHKVINDEPRSPREVADDPSKIPKQVDTLLLEGLSKLATGRFEAADDFAAAVREAYEVSGMVSPDEFGRPPSRRISITTPPPKESSKAGFMALLVALVGLGVGLVYMFRNDGDPVAVVVDGSTDSGMDAAAEDIDASPLIDAEIDATRDAGVEVQDAEPADGDEDADAEELDAEADVAAMTPHDREEAAKDALDRARALLADGDTDGARSALAEAERYDPGNPDVEDLSAQLPSSEDP